MSIRIGLGNPITNLKLGTTTVSKVYVGNTQVYPNVTVPIVGTGTVLILIEGTGISGGVFAYDLANKSLARMTGGLLPAMSAAAYDVDSNHAILWLNNANNAEVAQYSIVKSPLSVTNTVSYDNVGHQYSEGLSAGNVSNIIIGVRGNSIYRLDLSTNTQTFLLSVPSQYYIAGDIMYVPGSPLPSVIVSNYFWDGASTFRYYVSEFDIEGSLIRDVDITSSGAILKGLCYSGGFYYGITASGQVYRITSGGATLYDTLSIPGGTVLDATQLFNPTAHLY